MIKTEKLDKLQKIIHANAKAKGFWDGDGHRSQSTLIRQIALVGCEVSEAIEALRESSSPAYTTPIGKPEGWAIELADAAIRIMDLLEFYDISLLEMIRVKHEYNKKRPRKHGKRF